MAGVCVSVTFLALCVIRNREIIARRISSGTFHAIAKDDQKFLDDLLRNENQEGQQQLDTARVPVANAELQINVVRRFDVQNWSYTVGSSNALNWFNLKGTNPRSSRDA